MKPSERIRQIACDNAVMPSFDDDHEHYKIGVYIEAILQYLDEEKMK